jgi:RNA polymerase sigma factor (sigma-70 family)
MEHVLVDRAPVRLRRPARLLRLASDDRLVALVRAGEEDAFEALYDRHHPAILGFCRHMLGTREEAEDAVQHTFLAAFRDLVRDEKSIELRPWLFAIARNRCVSLLRARRAHVAIELAEPATDGLAATVERREDLRELLADLARLPEDQRTALLLAELGALDHAAIATILGCPREKVKALVFQARTSLAASRKARTTPCDEIRIELSSASGAALRRGPLRRHLRACDGCRAFKAEVAMQRKLLALALPVVPTITLKASVLSTTVGAGSGASGGGLGGVLGAVASAGAGKVAVSLAVAGVVAGGGTLAERLEHRPAPGPALSSEPTATSDASSASPFTSGAPTRTSAGHRRLNGASTTHPPAHLDPPLPVSPAATRTGTPASQIVPPVQAPADPGQPEHPLQPAHPTPGGNPADDSDAPPPGQSETPPGRGGTPPGRSGTPPGQGSTPPGQEGAPPGQGSTPPGQGSTPPGQGNTPPGHGGAAPGQGNTSPGNAKDPGPVAPPGHGGSPPGQSKSSSTPPESGKSLGNGR